VTQWHLWMSELHLNMQFVVINHREYKAWVTTNTFANLFSKESRALPNGWKRGRLNKSWGQSSKLSFQWKEENGTCFLCFRQKPFERFMAIPNPPGGVRFVDHTEVNPECSTERVPDPLDLDFEALPEIVPECSVLDGVSIVDHTETEVNPECSTGCVPDPLDLDFEALTELIPECSVLGQPGLVTIVTGHPGSGKKAVLNSLCRETGYFCCRDKVVKLSCPRYLWIYCPQKYLVDVLREHSGTFIRLLVVVGAHLKEDLELLDSIKFIVPAICNNLGILINFLESAVCQQFNSHDGYSGLVSKFCTPHILPIQRENTVTDLTEQFQKYGIVRFWNHIPVTYIDRSGVLSQNYSQDVNQILAERLDIERAAILHETSRLDLNHKAPNPPIAAALQEIDPNFIVLNPNDPLSMDLSS